jgi:predicted RNase H-like nuclease (RuvC/YqgF family)
MSIVVYILIIAFGFLIVNHIFEHGFKAVEGMVVESIHKLKGTVGEKGHSISNLKKKLNKTLDKSKKIKDKLNSAKNAKSANKETDKHSSMQSLNIQSKASNCEGFQNENILNKLQSKSLSHTSKLGVLNGIISNINSNIKTIENGL